MHPRAASSSLVRAIITVCTIILLLDVKGILGGLDDNLRSGESKVLKLLGVRSGHLGTGDSLDGGIKVVPSPRVVNDTTELGAHTKGGEAGLHGHQAVSLLDGVENGLRVKGLDGSQVDDLGVNVVVLLEQVGGVQSGLDVSRVADKGDVLTLSLNLGLAKGQNEIGRHGLLGHGERLTVHHLVLKENGHVGVSDSSLEQTLGILRAVGRNDLETGDLTVPSGEILGVLSTDTGSGTVGASEGDVTLLGSSRHVVGLGTRVDDLVNGLHGEVPGHELTDGLETSEGSTDTDTGETHLGDGGVDDSSLAKLVEQALGDLVGSVVLADFLAHDEDVVVSVHLLSECGVESISDGHLG